MTNFATTFNKLRKSKGLTQKELAKALDVTQTAITYWETGKREPSIEMLEKIANYFDVSLDYLFTAQTDKSNLQKKTANLSSKALNPGDIILDITKENFEKYHECFCAAFNKIKESYQNNADIVISMDTGEEIDKKELFEIINNLTDDEKLYLMQNTLEKVKINTILNTVSLYFLAND